MARGQKEHGRNVSGQRPTAKVFKKVAKPLITEILKRAGPEASREQIDKTADRLFGELRDIVGEMLPVNAPPNPALIAFLDEIKPEECGFSLEEGNKRLETRLISAALARTGGNVVGAAEILGLGETEVRYRMDKYGIGKDVKGQPDIEGVSLLEATEALEERFIRAALKETGGDRTSAAEMLGLKQNALLIKIEEHGLRHL